MPTSEGLWTRSEISVENFQPLSNGTASLGGKPSRGERLSPPENGVRAKLHYAHDWNRRWVIFA